MLNTRTTRPIAVAGLAMTLAACASDSSPTKLSQGDPVALAQRFDALLDAGDYESAREMMAENPRLWFDQRSGDGLPWEIGPGKTGPWAKWDSEFNKRAEVVDWRSTEEGAVLTYRETNDYFLLLDRGWVTNETVYLVDGQGRIEGLMHRPAQGPRPPGRTDEFLAWARVNEPEELAELMPDGDIDPSGDHPRRMRALLERWRNEAGLPPSVTE